MATSSDGSVVVSPDNFARAESDLYFGNIVKDNGFGKFFVLRELTPIDHQLVIRANRDTLYSAAIFDLDAGPVTVTIPDAGEGEHTITREQIGTRYVAVPVRILVDPNDPDDVAAVHKLQDGLAVKQDKPGRFDVPSWDPVSQKLFAMHW